MSDERPHDDVAGETLISAASAPPPAPPGDGPAPPPGPPVGPPSKRLLGIWIGIGLAVLALGVWLVIAKLPRFLASPPPLVGTAAPAKPTAGAPGGATAEARRIRATLFVVADDGSELVPVSREVLYGATPAEQARRIIEAQVEKPADGKVSAIPAGTTVRAVFLARGGEAYVDLGGTIVSGHTGGSLNEALTVYAIVNAVTINLPDVTAVQILIEGKEVDTLAGHLDLRAPLAKGLEWVRKGQ
jgi:hypothetical protein